MKPVGSGTVAAEEGYAELCVTSNFTFLTGASHPEELVARAAELGISAIAVTDRNSLAGVVRAHSALREIRRALDEGLTGADGTVSIRGQSVQDPSSRQERAGGGVQAPPRLPRLIIGTRLVLEDSATEWLALPTDRAAYARLSRLLSLGKRRVEKGHCRLTLSDLQSGETGGAEGMILIALPPDPLTTASPDALLRDMARRFPGQVYLGAAPAYDGRDTARLRALADTAQRSAVPMVAVGDVIMHHARRRRLADILTCIRERITIDAIGRRALPNAERRLKSPRDMARLFRDHPAALRRTLEIAGRCAFSLDELSYEYPDEITGTEPPQDRLERLTGEGLRRRFPRGVPADTLGKVEKELRIIKALGFSSYFLTVNDIVSFARGRGILCQGRGSAANSVICYALGITEVAPDTISMVFERFMSEARGEPPDIDVDFEHERREEVIQHIYETYGRHRAGLTATVIHFRSRAAIREVGKVMGLSEDLIAALAGSSWGWTSRPPGPEALAELGLNPEDRRLAQTLHLIAEIIGFPRHLSQHVGGFVITKGRLDELCPIENAAMEERTVIEWDKDDINALGILKVDVLSLGMLTCIRKSFDLIAQHGGAEFSLENLPREDMPTYDMLCRADAIGVFQVESRAQMNFLPRMRPREFYDLVIEVAIIRPGPIQGGMVHPYINRRQGREPVNLPSTDLRPVLERTLGVPLFQEQAMQIAVVAAGFSPEEADRLRRSLATFKRMGTIATFRDRFIGGMLERGYELPFAEQCFAQIEGFGEYGFPESHAASFALLVYASAYLKCHHPAAFACALLNSQPMGFYAPAQIVRDVREHGVEVRPVCVNRSDWDNTLEPRADGRLALRLGFRQIKGLREADAEWIVAARGNGYPDPESLWQRAGVPPAALERLAEADAFAGMRLNRRDALWAVRAIRAPKPLPLFGQDGEGIAEDTPDLPQMTLGEQVIDDYLALRLSLRAHPMEILRPHLPGLTAHADLPKAPNRVSVCGLVITRQRPGTASGVIFITLEDETDVCNVVVWPKVYERFRRVVIGGRLLRVTGRLQREQGIIHLIAEEVEDLSPTLSILGDLGAEAIDPTEGRGDETRRPVALRELPARHPLRLGSGATSKRHPREQAKILFPSRDFH
ncbi:error-prone DNA polymerase [Pararhodobacter oceanensis]|uniref:Error-prone DNA polymerase n=1 Tax=Pararhodobacter oceanensis TaxID=2172121 RepID=A0A2T8HRX7_9RHOB|nr:error-prone DNA polymerase [Pararhodobacter oceanensis]PVH28180.1 error-prone DNA polymerase [Pararhodobacter oceanensis]